ncbi:hypothetical protein D3C75_573260 [compost metagenome]
MLDALFGQALAHRAVLQVQMRGAVEGETHTQDQPTPRLLLEQAVAVGEVALLQGKVAQFAGLAIEGGQAGEHVLDLDPIGADVLHWCRTDGAGNQAEVFQAGQSLGQCVLHKWMPGLARLGLDHHFAALIAQHANPARGHAQYQ